mmetsp:Transcript_26280/g.38485  ORF Transcript_26280/g.38485 Transcript_26280/m.38485 type:complete len:82 (+) Transcript_26280:724-969(+)
MDGGVMFSTEEEAEEVYSISVEILALLAIDASPPWRVGREEELKVNRLRVEGNAFAAVCETLIDSRFISPNLLFEEMEVTD